MKKLLLAAMAVIGLGMGVASAQTVTHGAPQGGNQYNWLEGGGG